MRKALSIVFLATGLALIIWSGLEWIRADFPSNNLLPYKNTFGTNIIHLGYIGFALLTYGAFDLWLQKKPNDSA